jgi:hypothetical protein
MPEPDNEIPMRALIIRRGTKYRIAEQQIAHGRILN